MRYVYEFEIWRGEKQWVVAPFGLEGATQGEDFADACESAADWLRETMLDYQLDGRTPPEPVFENTAQHGGVLMVVSVDASLDDVPKVSAAEAARMLGVSRGRISHMLASGLLDSWKDGRNTWVTLDSVEARKAETPKAGRPKKAAAV